MTERGGRVGADICQFGHHLHPIWNFPRNLGVSANPLYTLRSFTFSNLRLRRSWSKKMMACRQSGQRLPTELVDLHQDITRMIQWQKSQLQQGGPVVRKEYLAQLERYLQLYTEEARRLGNEGKREAAKEVLCKRNLVQRELQKFHQ
uniref:Uncharacterized protein n=1 Tax=Sphaerodactylus townsendi TaxID=933632 RepID=A0ACB8ELP2_9SAUR